MLNVTAGPVSKLCNGVTRRDVLRIGALGGVGLTLPQLYAAEAAAGINSSNKAIINIHLGGGPSHQDMFDLKPEAAVEYRGEFNPIATNVPGMEICEHFPTLATMADKFAVVRSLIGMHNDHSNFHTLTGYGRRERGIAGGRPSMGSVLWRLMGAGRDGAPPYISYNGGEPGYLGAVYRPYKPSGNELRLNGRLTETRLGNRTELLASLDSIRRDVDRSGQMDAFDSYTQRAVDVVTSGKVADALDTRKEAPEVVQRYGGNDGKMFLTSRRLVEAGVRMVTFNWGSWDTHGQNFTKLRTQLPKLDRAMSALLNDLEQRGMANDVSVVMWGEFGRTPRINKNAGRDHWSRVAMCFLAGGGMRLGQVIGSTTRNAEEAKDRPVHLQEVFSTLYHNMGVDVSTAQLVDTSGRPQYLLDHRQVIDELV